MWKDETGKLHLYRKDGSGKIESRMKHPSQVCFENELYTLKNEPLVSTAPIPDYIENGLAKIDDKAAIVLTKMLIPSLFSELTMGEKQDWAIYVNSLLHRSPEKLKVLDAKMRSIIAETLLDIKRLATPETKGTWDVCGKIFKDSNYCQNRVRTLLLSVIRDNDWINGLLNFKWLVISLDATVPYRFILTESPMVIVGEDDNIGMLALALTPDLLWIALPRTFDDSEDVTDLFKHATMLYNAAQVARKPKFIISRVELRNDGLHNYEKIFVDFVQLAVGAKVTA